MQLYADQPARRSRQLVFDAATLLWVVAWVLVARAVHDVVARLAAPGRTLESAGTDLRGRFADAADAVAEVPLLGDQLREPFDAAGGAASSITTAGVEIQDTVAQAALVAGLGTAVGPVLLALGVWLAVRLRFVRRAAAARAVLDTRGGTDLLALRALARQPTTALAALGADPVGAWRRGDEAVVARLAELELRDAGVRLRASR